jgi:hypothetical protein
VLHGMSRRIRGESCLLPANKLLALALLMLVCWPTGLLLAVTTRIMHACMRVCTHPG